MSMYYILEGHLPKPVELQEWLAWKCSADGTQQVAFTQLAEGRISTVFLGVGLKWRSVEPNLFETMVFGGEHHLLQWRYATWDEAIAGHKEIEKMCLNK